MDMTFTFIKHSVSIIVMVITYLFVLILLTIYDLFQDWKVQTCHISKPLYIFIQRLHKIKCLHFCPMLLSTYCWIVGIGFVFVLFWHSDCPAGELFFLFLSQVLIISSLVHSKCFHGDTLTRLLLCNLCGCRTEWLSGDNSHSHIFVVICLLRSSWVIFNSFFFLF